MLFTAVIAAMSFATATTYGADTISVNFSRGDGGNITSDKTGELGGIGASGWTNVSADNTAGTQVNNQDGVAAGTIIMSGVPGSWSSKIGAGDTLTSVVQKDYVDVSNNKETIYNINVDHDYWLSDITLYMSGDTANAKFASINVNGISYQGGTNVVGRAEWGSGGDPAGVTEYNDTNSITVTGVAGDLYAQNDYISTSARATLAGIQIKDASDTRGYLTTLSSGITNAADTTWSHQGAEVAYGDIAADAKNLGISASAEGSTLQLTGGENVSSIAAIANAVTIQADSAISVGTLFAYEGASLAVDTALKDSVAISGKGSVLLNGENNLSSLKNGGNLTINGKTTVAAYSGSGSIAISGGATVVHQSDAAGLILSATGTGTIEISATTIINGTDLNANPASANTTTSFAGNISVKGGTLVLGNNGQWNGKWGVDLSSLSSIDLDGGNMKLFGSRSDLSVINVNQAASMNIWEASAVDGKGFAIEKLVLNANLTSHATWDSNLSIGVLEGTGNIKFTRDRGYNVSIGAIEGCGIIENGATMILGADETSTLNLSHTIKNTGSITVNGVVNISDDISGFTIVASGEEGGLSVNGTDGYMTTTGSTYLLLDNNGGSVTFNPETATYNGESIQLSVNAETGDVTFVGGASLGTIYHANTTDITIGGVNATENTGRATGVIVAEGRTVTIAGGTDTCSASEIFKTTSGQGNVQLSTNVTLTGTEATAATGTLSIGSGTQLTIGGSDTHTASIASFNKVELDGGKIYFSNKEDTFNNLTTTTKGGELYFYDMGQTDTGALTTLAGTTTLNGNLTVKNTYNTQLAVEKLAGTGNFILDGSDSAEAIAISINGSDNYSGKVHVTNKATNLQLTVAADLGVQVLVDSRTPDGVKNGIDLTGIGAGNTVTLKGARGYFAQDSTIVADVVISNSDDGQWAGMEIIDGSSNSTNTFAGSVSGAGNFVLNHESLANFKTKFTGDVSGWTGKLDLAQGDNYVIFTGDATEINTDQIIMRAGDGKTADLTFNHDQAVTVKSKIARDNGTVSLTLNNSSEAGITFTAGSIAVNNLTLQSGTKAAFTGITNLSVTNLTLDADTMLTIGNGTAVVDGSASPALAVTGTAELTGGATINGGLDLSNATAITLNGMDAAITINGDLTLPGTAISLSGDVLEALSGLTAGQQVALFDVTGAFTLGETEISLLELGDKLLTDVFSVANVEWNEDLYLGYDGTTVYAGVMDTTIPVDPTVPEPTTATLSLLALAALAARRRRR